MDKEQFITNVEAVANVVYYDEYLTGIIELSDTSKYIALDEKGKYWMTQQTGIHYYENILPPCEGNELGEKLLAHIDLSKVIKGDETCEIVEELNYEHYYNNITY